MKGFSSDIYYENQVGVLEVKLTKVWQPPGAGSPGISTLGLVHLEFPAAHQLQLRVFYSDTGFCSCISPLISWDFLWDKGTRD